jgi:biopolymer transport protein TolQ
MFNIFYNASALSLLKHTDTITRFILLFLFCMSVTCIAIVVLKFIFFQKEVKGTRQLLTRARTARTIDDFIIIKRESAGTLGGVFLDQGLGELNELLRHRKDSTTSSFLSEDESSRFDLMLTQALDDATLDAEKYLPVLGTSAAVAPLIGLFGTVWGLIHAFINIGHAKSADLAVVAPGIAEALLTTLVGLIVAIPAMIFFHYYSNELRKLEQQLCHLSDRLFATVHATLVFKKTSDKPHVATVRSLV